MIIKKSRGIDLLIYDNEPQRTTGEPRIKDVLWGLQKSLWELARKAWSPVTVWYSTDASQSGRDNCLPSTMRQVRAWAGRGDCGELEEADARIQGYVKLVKP